MPGPLDGIRIIDLSQMATGPFATMQLADQGADVVKVEPPGLGDALRGFGFWSKNGMSAVIAGCNRGKRSLAVDMSQPAGVDVVRRLVGGADVFVENFRPGVVQRMGLDPDDLRAENPGLVTASISGYGLEGAWVDRPVLDPVIQGLTGHVANQVNPDIPFPDLVRHVVVDKATACYVAQAITAALFRRTVDGHGQHIDLSMVDASLSFLWPDGMMQQTLLDDDVTEGYTIAELYSLTDCADGKVVFFAGTIAQRLGLYRAIGRPEWCEDERYNTFETMFADEERLQFLRQTIADAFAAMTVEQAVDALARNDVPGGPVLTHEQVPAHPQIVANDSLVVIDDPTLGRTRHPRPPARYSHSPSNPDWVTPTVGQHSDEILVESGFGPDDVVSLREAGVIA